MRSYLQFTVGDAYDAGKVDQSIKALFATGLFADVRIDRDGAGVRRHRGREPGHQPGRLRGQQRGRQGDAAERGAAEAALGLHPRPACRPTCSASSTSIAARAASPPRVEPKIIELDSNRVNLVFEINEGGATKVKSINFIGNRAFSDTQLRDIITTTQSGWFDFLKGTNIYDPDRLTLDRELLRQYYLKNGYADARVVSASAELDRDGSGFFITFVVDEGELYNFGDDRHRDQRCRASTRRRCSGELLTIAGHDLRRSRRSTRRSSG